MDPKLKKIIAALRNTYRALDKYNFENEEDNHNNRKG